MEDLDAASLDDVSAFFRTYYAPNNAVLASSGDCDRATVRALAEKFFGADPGEPGHPAAARHVAAGDHRRRDPRDGRGRVPLPRVHFGFRAPAFGDTRLDALEVAAQLLAGGKGSRLHRRLVRDERVAQDVAVFALPLVAGASICSAGRRCGRASTSRRVEAAYLEELERLASEVPTDDELARANALTEADELGALARVEERADRLSMFATLFDDPELINTPAAALPVGHAGADPRRGARCVPRRQPRRAHLRPAGRRDDATEEAA